MRMEPADARRSGGSSTGGAAAGIVPAKVRAPRVRWLARERLDQLVPRLWQHRLTLVVAPAGSGKTTLLAAWAGLVDAPAAWYRAESVDGSERSLAAHLAAAFATVLPDLEATWQTVDEAAAALDARPEDRLLLVIDDLHLLTGTPAEAALERFLDYAPPSLAVVAGTRVAPSFNLSRRRVAGEILELSGDDLRFRPWEVERLFRDFYGEALRTDELARLARRTEGWAAGLQLFHLATRGKAAAERQRLLAGLGPSSRLMREYLARNVVAELPDELREFLVGTCVLRRLTGSLCDRLLERHGSRALLEELERRSVFTVAVDDEGTYRYHEVLRSHLEGMLVETAGETAARARARRGGELLEGDGAIAEAVAAYCRAEDWAAVDRLLDRHGERLAARQGAWMDTLPPSLLVQDPWLILATARRHRAEGRWAPALDAYGRAEVLLGSGEAGAACRRERLALAGWLDPLPAPAADWSGALRAAIAHDPLVRRPAGDDASGRLVAAGLGALVGGRVAEARRILRLAADEESGSPVMGATAALGAAIAGLLAGDARAVVETEQAVAATERAGLGWLARVGRAALSIAGAPAGAEYARSDATAVRHAAARDERSLGRGPGRARRGLGRDARTGGGAGTARGGGGPLPQPRGGEPGGLGPRACRAGARPGRRPRRARGGPGRRGGRPLHRHRGPGGRRPARPGGAGPARARGAGDGRRRPPRRGRPRPAGRRTIRRPPPPGTGGGAPATGPDGAGRVEIRLFGSFAMTIDGRPLDLGGLKPRPRAVLRFLALNAGRPVHREVLQETFWPEADPETGAKNLHVALSALRRELTPRAGRGASELLVRDGDAYRLALPEAARIDLADFERAVTEARTVRARGATQVAIEAFRTALAAYGGDLLPEDGPATWAAGRRDRARDEAVEAARALAELLLDGDPTAAAEACAAGLALDPQHDPLWRILVVARERAGDPAAATSARSGYARMLADLGVTAADDA